MTSRFRGASTSGLRSIGGRPDVVLSMLLLFVGLSLPYSFAQSKVDVKAVTEQAKKLRVEQYKIATSVLQEFPNDFNAIRVMGFAHSSHGNREKMFLCWKRCQELKPNRPDVYDQLGRFYAGSEQHDQAIQSWNKALQLAPTFPNVRQRIGKSLLEMGKAEQAAAALKQQIKLTPKNVQTLYILGEAYFQQQEFEKAKSSFEAALQLEPQHSQACYGLVKTSARLSLPGELEVYSKRFAHLESKAIRADIAQRRQFDDLTKMKERLAVTCVDAGRVYMIHHRTDQANALWERAGQVDCENVSSRLELARLHLSQGRLSAAAECYAELGRIQPHQSAHNLQAGRIYVKLKDFPSAESMFQTMIRNQANDAAGYRALARFYLNTNQKKDQALKLARRAVELEPVADSHFLFGWSNAMNGNVQEARAALKKAIDMDPKNATFRKVLAIIERNSR